MHIPFPIKGYLSGSTGLPGRSKRGVWFGGNQESWVLACHSHSTDPRRGCRAALRLCSLLSRRLAALSHRSTVRDKHVSGRWLSVLHWAPTCHHCMVNKFLPAKWNTQAREP